MEPGYASMWISPPRFYGAQRSVGIMVAYAAPLAEIFNAQGIFNENQFGVTPINLPGARYVFFLTTDQGETWEDAAVLDISNPTPFSIPTSNIFVVLEGTTLHRSGDGGQTWNALETNLAAVTRRSGREVQITAIQFVGVLYGWAWGVTDDRLYLYATTDGGAVWEEIDLTQ
jgi:hypothetical protein